MNLTSDGNYWFSIMWKPSAYVGDRIDGMNEKWCVNVFKRTILFGLRLTSRRRYFAYRWGAYWFDKLQNSIRNSFLILLWKKRSKKRKYEITRKYDYVSALLFLCRLNRTTVTIYKCMLKYKRLLLKSLIAFNTHCGSKIVSSSAIQFL